MSALDLICQAYDRLQRLQSRAGDLTPTERQDLGNLPSIIGKLWERRRCEMLGATAAEPESYRADRAGMRSVAITVTHATARRPALVKGEHYD